VKPLVRLRFHVAPFAMSTFLRGGRCLRPLPMSAVCPLYGFDSVDVRAGFNQQLDRGRLAE